MQRYELWGLGAALGDLQTWIACLLRLGEALLNEAMQGVAVALERQDVVSSSRADRSRDLGGAAVGVGGDGGAGEVQELEQFGRGRNLAGAPVTALCASSKPCSVAQTCMR